ncbi:hypothetical protein [uncultured Sneathiella sp.]|jgi:hypothetical protein|uniref:hypothetical protein n=1 Tax=uncultured Sneathiella sp. TaxID=879315 RepID=UPI0030DC6719|tara:strand:+ start:456 stop:818 length:363 start_codon:yes stop_codon:yes gene_type:complete
MKYANAVAVLGAAFFLSVTAAGAATLCLPRSELRLHLAQKYGEILIAQGLDNRGMLTEIFATKSRDRWSLTETDARGRSCLRAAGEYWNAQAARPDRTIRQPAATPSRLHQKPEVPDGQS